MTIKQRVHGLLTPAKPGDKVSRIFDIFLVTLIGLNVLALVIQTVEPVVVLASGFFRWFEIVSVIIFSIEYVLRVWSCVADENFRSPFGGRIRFARTPLALIDFLAVLPFYLPTVGIDLRFLRAVRLFRIFRILKLGRYSEALQRFGRVFVAKKEELMMTVFVLFFLLIVSSALMYHAEHEVQPDIFSSIPATMWWGVATLSTVGYGDVYPVTAWGKVLGSVIAILGIGMFALPTGISCLYPLAFLESSSTRSLM